MVKSDRVEMLSAAQVIAELKQLGDSTIAEHSQRFFKTGKGEYGEGDIFLGIRVLVLRKQVPRLRAISMEQLLEVLASPYHEARLLALLIMVDLFKRGDEPQRERIYQLYLRSTQYTNNWDLVDLSSYHIVGAWLENRDTDILKELAVSESLWERRIATVSTYFFIRQERFDLPLDIAALLLHDSEDLIHKAVGWMLREVGKRNFEVERDFLCKHYSSMPRTMLRYAIERFPEEIRLGFLHGTIEC